MLALIGLLTIVFAGTVIVYKKDGDESAERLCDDTVEFGKKVASDISEKLGKSVKNEEGQN